MARFGGDDDFGVWADFGEAGGGGERAGGLDGGEADGGRGGGGEVDGDWVGGGDAADLGDEVELEEVGVELDDFPVGGGEGLDVEGVRGLGVEVEVEGDLR